MSQVRVLPGPPAFAPIFYTKYKHDKGETATLRLIEITAPEGYGDSLIAAAQEHDALDVMAGPVGEDGRQFIRVLVGPGDHQPILDALQTALGGSRNWRIALMPVEAAILSPEKDKQAEEAEEEAKESRYFATGVTREELRQNLVRGTRPDTTFFVLTFLSAIVAAVGLLNDNIAVVIGAMVIAPLLGPNLAFTFASATADKNLMIEAMKANAIGVGLTLGLSVLIGLGWPGPFDSNELMARTDVSYGSVVLALASGAAAVLSISSGISAALVGVMVAVALLPPAAALGLMLGNGEWTLARGAFLLLAINVICVNLAAQIIFMIGGLRPRTWFEQQTSKRTVLINIGVWGTLLAAASAAIRFLPA